MVANQVAPRDVQVTFVADAGNSSEIGAEKLRAGHRSKEIVVVVVSYTYRTLGKIILCMVLVLLSVVEGSLEVSVVARSTFPINMHKTLTTTNYQTQLQLTTTNYN